MPPQLASIENPYTITIPLSKFPRARAYMYAENLDLDLDHRGIKLDLSQETCIYRHKWETIDPIVFAFVQSWLREKIESWGDRYRNKEAYLQSILEELRGNPNITIADSQRYATRLSRCCDDWLLYRDKETGEFIEQPSLCKVPFCPYCRLWYTLRARRRVEEHLARARKAFSLPIGRVLYGEVTQRGSSGRSAKQSYRDLRDSLRRLWRDPYVRDTIQGAIVVIEYTISSYSGFLNWHYHANLIVGTREGIDDKTAARALRESWGRATRDDRPEEIRSRLERLRPGFIQEMVKYAAKPYDASKPHNINPWFHGLGHEILSMRGSRLISTVLGWYRLPRDDPEKSKLEYLGSIKKIAFERKVRVDTLQYALARAEQYAEELEELLEGDEWKKKNG